MFDPKEIHTRLLLALSDAILIEQTPVRRHEMQHLFSIIQNRYKPKENKAVILEKQEPKP
jgi:hypothetical protein